MDPQAELQQWFQARQALEQRYGKDQLAFRATQPEMDLYNGKGLSPDAYRLQYRGNDQHQRFNADTGQMQDKPGYWGHWESWIPVIAGGAMGGIGLAGGLAGASGAAPAATSASATGGVGGATSAALGADAAGVPATAGLASGAGVGAAAGIPSMADLGGLVAGGAGAFDAAGNWVPKAAGAATSLLTDPKWSPLLKALAGVGGLIGGKVLGERAQQNAVPPELSQLLQLAMQRANAQTPLFNAVNQGTYDMLPDFAKKGGG